MATVYLETTIPSYLTSRVSRDLVVAAHQQLTQQWWAEARQHFEVVVSEVVIDEIKAGDPGLAEQPHSPTFMRQASVFTLAPELTSSTSRSQLPSSSTILSLGTANTSPTGK